MNILKLAVATFVMAGLAAPVAAKYQKNITGRDPQEVQQNAFEADMDYPVGPLRCDQRCSQWWERQ